MAEFDCGCEWNCPESWHYCPVHGDGRKSIAPPKSMLTLGEKSTCVHCGHEIEYIGQWWRHIGLQPRHIAEPKK